MAVASLPAEIAADARRRLEMTLVIAGKAQNEVRGAGIGIGLDPGGGRGARAGEALLPLARLQRIDAVILLQIGVEPVVGAFGIVVYREREVYRCRETGRVTAGGACSRRHLRPFLRIVLRQRGV